MIFLDLSKNILKDILNPKTNFNNIKKKLIEEVKKKHNIEKLREFKKDIEDYWTLLNDLFFNNLKITMGFDFKYKKYIVYITEIIRGSYGDKNIVYTNPLGIKTSAYITSEEILHLYYWDIYGDTIKNIKHPWKENNQVWEISEVIPEFIFTDDLFKSFGWGKDLNRNYSFIESWKEKLQPLWDDKKDFFRL